MNNSIFFSILCLSICFFCKTNAQEKVFKIYFETNLSVLSEEYKLGIDSIISDLSNQKLNIEAQSDSRGNSLYNLNLSKQRALNVKRYLLMKPLDCPQPKAMTLTALL